MNEHIFKSPPSGGVRYTKTSELQKRIMNISQVIEKIPQNGHGFNDHKYYDQIKQYMAQIELSLNKAKELPPEKAYFYLNEIQALLKSSLEQVYELSLGLYENMLGQFGLLPVLIWYIESYTLKTNIRVNFKHHSLIRNFKQDICAVAYNVIKEALENISRNNTESEVTVQVWVEEEVLNISIWNYRLNSTQRMISGKSAGIESVKEQVRALGGRLVIDTSSGSTARLLAELPLSRRLSNFRLY